MPHTKTQTKKVKSKIAKPAATLDREDEIKLNTIKPLLADEVVTGEIDEKLEEEIPLADGETDEFAADELSLDDEEVDPFGDKWEE